MRAWIAAMGLLLAAGCSTKDVLEALEGQAPLGIAEDGLAVPVTVEAVIRTGAVVPTDLQGDGAGGFVVLDGWGRRLLAWDSAGRPAGVVQGSSAWGHPTRFAPWDGGWLLADPGAADAPGGLVSISATGAVRGLLSPSPAPLALAPFDGGLLVADRQAGLLRCDASATRCDEVTVATPAPLLSDLAVAGDGALLLAEPLAARVHAGPLDGLEEFGGLGQHVGAMGQPKGVASAQGAVLVADSALGVVQLLDRRGRALGPLVADGELLRFDHPVAVRVLAPDRWAVLAAGSGEVSLLRVDPEAIAARIAAPHARRLRTHLPIAEPGERASCLQCHDGFVLDSRAAWDPSLAHHPVGEVPDRPLPAFFTLDEEGRIACRTCHAPHGTVDLDDALAVEEPKARASLVRHASAGMTRLDRDALCVPCHEGAAHGGLSRMGGLVTGIAGHPVGGELQSLLDARPGEAAAAGGCLGCHAPHGASSDPLLRGDELGGTCLGCHEERAAEATNHPVGIAFSSSGPQPRASARLALDDAGGIGCHTCHDPAAGSPPGLLRSAADGGPLCLACHQDRAAVSESAHASIEGPHGLPCLGCHAPHGAERSDHLVRPARAGDDGCLDCHGEGAAHAPAEAAPGALGHPVTRADDPSFGCSSCHDVHTPDRDTAPCGSCHEEQDAASRRLGGHGGVACAGCHAPHAEPPAPPPSAAGSNPASLPCLTCHAPDATSEATSRVVHAVHPDPVFLPDGRRWKPLGVLPLFGPDGEALPDEANGALTCLSCHRTHGAVDGDIEPLRRKGIVNACAACHGEASLPLYRWFHEPERREGVPISGGGR